ncbi:uncharacterized protein LOC143470393 isoform X2 [Clavelina lepadiformis]
MCNITELLQKFTNKASKFAELFDWMNSVSFQTTLDDIGFESIEHREEEVVNSYKNIALCFQKMWQCAQKLEQLLCLFSADDTYDVLSGKIPTHILANRNKNFVLLQKLWCSQKLRHKLQKFEKLRSELCRTIPKEDTDCLPVFDKINSIPVLKDNDAKSMQYQEIGIAIQQEISDYSELALLDVVFYIREAYVHKFTKPSCRKRLSRSVLILEFIKRSLEKRAVEINQFKVAIGDSQNVLKKIEEEAVRAQIELKESQKALKVARRKITQQKKQLDTQEKEKEELNNQISSLQDKIILQEKMLEEATEFANQSEVEDVEYKSEIDEPQEYQSTQENQSMQEHQSTQEHQSMEESYVESIKEALESRNNECNILKKSLQQEKNTNVHLVQSLQSLKDQHDELENEIIELSSSITAQENKIMSLRLMVYYKDEIIRRLKQGAMDLKLSEKHQETPPKPPPSPETTELPNAVSSTSPLISTKEKRTNATMLQRVQKHKKFTSKASSQMSQRYSLSNQQSSFSSLKKIAAEKGADQEKYLSKKASTKVLMSSKERQKFYEEKHELQQALYETKKKVHDVTANYQAKLKQTVEQVKQKLVMDKMKTDENLQNLCFSVRDEMMRIQKEMLSFNKNMAEQLGIQINIKDSNISSDFRENENSKHMKGLVTVNNVRMKEKRINDTLYSSKHSDNADGVIRDPLKGHPSNVMKNQKMLRSALGVKPDLMITPSVYPSSGVDSKIGGRNATECIVQTSEMKVENVQDKQNNDRIDAFISTKKYARFGESSASSRLLHVMQMARRQNIFPVYLSPPSAVRFNSFSQLNGSDKLSSKQSFNQHSKISHDELVRRRKLRLLKDRERKLKARKAMLTSSADSDDDPLKKAKDFISAISSQVGTFLEVVNKSILSSIKQEKKKMALQLEDMERKLRKNNMLLHAEKMKNKEYLSHVMEKSRKGIHTKFASIGHGKVHLLQHKTHQRLNHLQSSLTSVCHEKDFLQQKLETAENLVFQFKKQLQQEKASAKSMRICLNGLAQSTSEMLFLSLRHHKWNYNKIMSELNIKYTKKQVILKLLKCSMRYPGQAFRHLVHRYQQHHALQRTLQTLQSPRQGGVVVRSRNTDLILMENLKLRHCQLWTTKRKQLLVRRQNLLFKILCHLQKIRRENNLQLVQPVILLKSVSGRAYERIHNNSPTNKQSYDCNKTKLHTPAPVIRSMMSTSLRNDTNSEKDQVNNDLQVKQPKTFNYGKHKQCVAPTWSPEGSLFCPFTNMSANNTGRSSQLNKKTHATLYDTTQINTLVDSSTGIFGKYKTICHDLVPEYPHMLFLDTQSPYSEAKKRLLDVIDIKSKYF